MLSPMDGPNGVPVEAPARIKVLLVDDHAVVRRGLHGFFELLDDIEVVGEAEDGQRAVELVGELAPDVVLMDLLMPVMDGITAIGQVKREAGQFGFTVGERAGHEELVVEFRLIHVGLQEGVKPPA